jgi:hypothetical protein
VPGGDIEEIGERAAIRRAVVEQLRPQLVGHVRRPRQWPAAPIAGARREAGAGEQDRVSRVDQLGEDVHGLQYADDRR